MKRILIAIHLFLLSGVAFAQVRTATELWVKETETADSEKYVIDYDTLDAWTIFLDTPTEAGLEAFLTDVSDVITNNDTITDIPTAGASGTAPVSNGAGLLVNVNIATQDELDSNASADTDGTGAANRLAYWFDNDTLDDIANGTDGQLLLGDTSAAPLFATMSGDATITDAGVVAIHSSAFANPSATVNGTAVNGSATTLLRSDGAPPLADPLTPADGNQNITGSLTASSALGADGTSGITLVIETSGLTYDATNNRVGINNADPTEPLDVNGATIRIRSANTPASATATGDAGEMCWDSGFLYVCVATDTWKRAALSTW